MLTHAELVQHEAEAAVMGSDGVGERTLKNGARIFWRREAVADCTSKPITQHLRQKTVKTAKRPRVDPRSSVLDELNRKKAMIEKYGKADATESKRIVELTEKWKEVALEAFEDLKKISGAGAQRTDYELLSMMQVDPALLGVEREEEEEEDEEKDDDDDE